MSTRYEAAVAEMARILVYRYGEDYAAVLGHTARDAVDAQVAAGWLDLSDR